MNPEKFLMMPMQMYYDCPNKENKKIDIIKKDIYQIVTATKRDRALYVQKKLKYQGIELSYDYIREHLAEL